MTEQLMEEQAPAVAPVEPSRVSWATVPKVNLLPLEIVEGRRFRRVKMMLGLIVLAGVLVALAGIVLAQREVSSANDDLAVAQSQVQSLQTEAAKYSAVPQITKLVAAATQARTDVMGQDVLWYQFMNDLEGALPAGVTQQTIAVSLASSTAPGAAAAATNPLSAEGIGNLTITGSAAEYREISTWLDALAKITGVTTPALTSATKSTDATGTTIEYTLGAVVSDSALSHRYDTEGS